MCEKAEADPEIQRTDCELGKQVPDCVANRDTKLTMVASSLLSFKTNQKEGPIS